MRTHRRAVLRDQRGFALFVTFLVLLILAALGSASLVYSNVDLKTSSYYKAGARALMASEAGLMHAISVMNTTLVWDIQWQLENGSWRTQTWMYGQTWQTLPNDPNAKYQVVVEADPADPDDQGWIVATGVAPLQSSRTIRVRIQRSGMVAGPGAIYLTNTNVQANFTGANFQVDGNNYALNGTDPAGDGYQRPGISTMDEASANNVKGALRDSNQRTNVQGLGYTPPNSTTGAAAQPSVWPSSGPSASEVETIIDNVLANSSPIYRYTSPIFNGNCSGSFGTLSAPQITHMTNTVGTRINGDFCGAGILIVDGPLTVQGTMNFTGWVLARSSLSLSGNGNAFIVGSVWTNGVQFGTGGSMAVNYSTAALQLANATGGNPNGNVPRRLALLTWEEL